MSLKTFEHVLILADDLKKTKEFYVDLLGLKDGYRPDFPFPGHWLYPMKMTKQLVFIWQ